MGPLKDKVRFGVLAVSGVALGASIVSTMSARPVLLDQPGCHARYGPQCSNGGSPGSYGIPYARLNCGTADSTQNYDCCETDDRPLAYGQCTDVSPGCHAFRCNYYLDGQWFYDQASCC